MFLIIACCEFVWQYVVFWKFAGKRNRAVEDLETRKEREQELKREEIKQIRSEVPMVDIQDIGWVLDSEDLELKSRINTDGKKGGMQGAAERE